MISHSPAVVTENLLLNLDFKNPKKFNSLGSGNLVQYPNYNAATWTNGFPANTSLVTGIDAPDGSNTAVRVYCRTTGSSLVRCGLGTGAFTPNGTDTYLVSFFVRKVSGTTGGLVSDLHDANNYTYTSDVITGQWVRVVYSGVPTATAKTFVDLISDSTNDYVLDFWGVKVESTASEELFQFKETISNLIFYASRANYYSVNDDSITFDRAASAPKTGGVMYATSTGSLTATNFLYNNHTWEIWFKIADNTGGAYDGTESWSALMCYSGYHAGFMYSSTNVYYLVWNAAVQSNACLWSLGTGAGLVNQGVWCHLAAVYDNGTFTPYLNGLPAGTGSTLTMNATGNVVSNLLWLGGTAVAAPGAGSYLYYGKNTVANSKMYNRALTATEINQNFNALRGRFGL